MMKEVEIKDELKAANHSLGKILKEQDINKLVLISLGNSIASGFSIARTTRPLLERNDSLVSTLHTFGIEVEQYHFARARENRDWQVLDWCLKNITEAEMHRLNQKDYWQGLDAYDVHGLKEYDILRYYSTKEEGKRIQDVLFQSDCHQANLVFYHGGMGNFVESFNQHQILKALKGFDGDTFFMGKVLDFIWQESLSHASKTQVYLGGIPNFLGLHLVDFVNLKIQRLAKLYENTVYVKPVTSKLFYPLYQEDEEDKLTYIRDIHYDEVEYLKLNLHFIKSVDQNYVLMDKNLESSILKQKKKTI